MAVSSKNRCSKPTRMINFVCQHNNDYTYINDNNIVDYAISFSFFNHGLCRIVI